MCRGCQSIKMSLPRVYGGYPLKDKISELLKDLPRVYGVILVMTYGFTLHQSYPPHIWGLSGGAICNISEVHLSPYMRGFSYSSIKSYVRECLIPVCTGVFRVLKSGGLIDLIYFPVYAGFSLRCFVNTTK